MIRARASHMIQNLSFIIHHMFIERLSNPLSVDLARQHLRINHQTKIINHGMLRPNFNLGNVTTIRASRPHANSKDALAHHSQLCNQMFQINVQSDPLFQNKGGSDNFCSAIADPKIAVIRAPPVCLNGAESP